MHPIASDCQWIGESTALFDSAFIACRQIRTQGRGVISGETLGIMQLPNPITRLPIKRPDQSIGYVALRTVPMTQELVDIWMQEVQPIIDAHYQVSAEGVASENIRADVGWKWNRYFTWHECSFALRRVTGIKSNITPTTALCLAIEQKGRLFPIGMLIALPKFMCQVKDVRRDRSFTWYLSDAPADIYSSLFDEERVQGVAKALVDSTIQLSVAAGLQGEMLLHASPKGGAKLECFYREKCRMLQLHSSDSPVSTFRWKQPRNEFYYFDSQSAMEFCQLSDVHRGNHSVPQALQG